MTLNEQPSAIQALTAAIGPSIGYHISECRRGGYIVIVDGAIDSAWSTLPEAVHAMGEVAANKYGKSAVAPERATVVTPRDGYVEDDPDLDPAAGVAGQYGPRPPHMRRPPDGITGRAMSHVRRTAQVALFVLMIGSAVLWGRMA